MSATQSSQNSLWQKLGFGASLLGASSLLLMQSAQAVRLSNGQIAFEQPPHLVEASASMSTPDTPATYYFTLQVPETAGEPLGAIEIELEEGVEDIAFQVDGTEAFAGKPGEELAALPLASIGGAAEEGDPIVLAFDSPVAPGSTVTVSLEAKRNPNSGGIYLFGVTAYPAGEENVGQFLGFGRLRFIAD
ncbi:MAG: DUF2808 domain-containing protein [Cyanobacteriota bacterium]|nr:DUF2808 domain-containing protein [Cyanobacteriota bacterium]